MGETVTIPVEVEAKVVDNVDGDAVVAVDVEGTTTLPKALGDDDGQVLIPTEPQSLEGV